jgi:hypothetical protein
LASVTVRASDAERERALRALRAHYAAGRLDADELEERVAKATVARYRHELQALLADLPGGHRARAGRAAMRVDRAMLRGHVVSFATVNGALVAGWAVAGGGAFWPAAVLAPWGAVLAGHAYTSRRLRRVARRSVGAPPPRRRLMR